MNARTRNPLRNDAGASAVEYGLIAGLIAVAIILGATALGLAVDQQYQGNASTVVDVLP